MSNEEKVKILESPSSVIHANTGMAFISRSRVAGFEQLVQKKLENDVEKLQQLSCINWDAESTDDIFPCNTQYAREQIFLFLTGQCTDPKIVDGKIMKEVLIKGLVKDA